METYNRRQRRPKNYAYRRTDTVTGRTYTVSKVRCIILNYNAKQLVNFEVVKDLSLGTGEPTVMVHSKRNIKRKRKGGEMYP